ncbi:MAG: IS66 family insertion sequence element accessory protein TnpB [Cyanobacteriota/Melainabacteria group bacterium]
MLSIPASTKIYLCVLPVDMRRSFDSLAELVRTQMGEDRGTCFSSETKANRFQLGSCACSPMSQKMKSKYQSQMYQRNQVPQVEVMVAENQRKGTKS